MRLLDFILADSWNDRIGIARSSLLNHWPLIWRMPWRLCTLISPTRCGAPGYYHDPLVQPSTAHLAYSVEHYALWSSLRDVVPDLYHDPRILSVHRQHPVHVSQDDEQTVPQLAFIDSCVFVELINTTYDHIVSIINCLCRASAALWPFGLLRQGMVLQCLARLTSIADRTVNLGKRSHGSTPGLHTASAF